MEDVITRLLAGQPILVVLLAAAVFFLWRDLQKEREARVSMLREMLEVSRSGTQAIEKLTDTLRGRGV